MTMSETGVYIDPILDYHEFLQENNMDNTPWRYQVYALARQTLHKKIKALESALEDEREKLRLSEEKVKRLTNRGIEDMKYEISVLEEKLRMMTDAKDNLRRDYAEAQEKLRIATEALERSSLKLKKRYRD